MKCENPISFSLAQSSIAEQYAPDCEMKATFPLDGNPSAKEAFRLLKVEICPKQLGPRILIPCSLHFLAMLSYGFQFHQIQL